MDASIGEKTQRGLAILKIRSSRPILLAGADRESPLRLLDPPKRRFREEIHGAAIAETQVETRSTRCVNSDSMR